jgi:hypothetical protein
MALILISYIGSVSEPFTGLATKIYLLVTKSNLGLAYELPSEAIITGELMAIRGPSMAPQEKTLVEELLGKEVEFIFWENRVGTLDYLFISKKSWPILRDYAILPGKGYEIKVKLKEASYEGKKVALFPKRDVYEVP